MTIAQKIIQAAQAMLREGADPVFVMKTSGLTEKDLATIKH